jgi:hypothetical protein
MLNRKERKERRENLCGMDGFVIFAIVAVEFSAPRSPLSVDRRKMLILHLLDVG